MTGADGKELVSYERYRIINNDNDCEVEYYYHTVDMTARLEHDANRATVLLEADGKGYYGDARVDICDNNILDAAWIESHIAHILEGDSLAGEGDAHRTVNSGTLCEETQ